MKALIKTKLSPHKYKTPEGYLICQDAIIARTGVQEYLKSELFPDLEDTPEGNQIIKLYRMEEDVFDDKTLASFEHKPVTVEHPSEDVTPVNYKQYSVGDVIDVHKGEENGEPVMMANLFITDQRTIEDIENGIRTDLSCGYDCDITDDEHPRQINIRGNHVALCEEGRAGNARIMDSASKIKDALEDTKYIARGQNGNFYFVDSANDVMDDLGTSDEFEAVSVVYEKYGYSRDEISTHARIQDAKGGIFKAIKTLNNNGVSREDITNAVINVLNKLRGNDVVLDDNSNVILSSIGRQNEYDLLRSIDRLGVEGTANDQINRALYVPKVDKDETIGENFSHENKITSDLISDLDSYLGDGVYDSIKDSIDFGIDGVMLKDINMFNTPDSKERGLKFEFVVTLPEDLSESLSKPLRSNKFKESTDFINTNIFDKLPESIKKSFILVGDELFKNCSRYFKNKLGMNILDSYSYTTMGGDNDKSKKIFIDDNGDLHLNIELKFLSDRDISAKKNLLKQAASIDDAIRIRIAPQKKVVVKEQPKSDDQIFEEIIDNLYDKKLHKLFKKYGAYDKE